jgi:hypothetical protein
MRVLVCDVCQSAIKDGEKPFAFGVGTDHPNYAKKPESSWNVGGDDSSEARNPFMHAVQPFKFVKHWEMCAACGVQLMTVLEKAVALGRSQMEEFKKLMS